MERATTGAADTVVVVVVVAVAVAVAVVVVAVAAVVDGDGEHVEHAGQAGDGEVATGFAAAGG